MSEPSEDRGGIMYAIGEIKGMLSGFMTTQERHGDTLKEHDGRLQKLESLTARILFIGAIAGAGAGIAFEIIKKYVAAP